MKSSAFWIVLLVAVGARLGAWAMVERTIAQTPGREFVIAGDAGGYWDLGTDLASGREYAVHNPPRRIHRVPGVPAVVAASITLFGESKAAARGLLALLAAIGPVLIYGLGWRVGEVFGGGQGRRVGFIAGLLAAVSPLAVGLSPVILSDGLFAGVLAWLLCAAAPLVGVGPTEGENHAGFVRAGVCGVIAGIAVLTKPAWLPGVLFVAAGVWWFCPRGRKRGLGHAVLFISLFALTLAPWVARNAFVLSKFDPPTGRRVVLTTLWAGPTLYDSFRPDSDGGSDMSFYDRDAAGGWLDGMNEADVDAYYMTASRAILGQHPGHLFKTAVLKQRRFWSLWPRADEVPTTLVRVAVAVWSVTVFALAVTGLRRLWSVGAQGAFGATSRWAVLTVTLGPLLYFAALHLIFVGSMRYRMPAELPLCVLAALGVSFSSRPLKP